MSSFINTLGLTKLLGVTPPEYVGEGQPTTQRASAGNILVAMFGGLLGKTSEVTYLKAPTTPPVDNDNEDDQPTPIGGGFGGFSRFGGGGDNE